MTQEDEKRTIKLSKTNDERRKSMKAWKRVSGIVAVALALLSGVSGCAAGPVDGNAAEPVDRSGQVTRIDMTNGDGTFTTLEGEEAQLWYDQAIAEGERRMIQEAKLESISTENRGRIRNPFHYKYRYLESRRVNDVKRIELEKTVTRKLENESSVTQPYTSNWSVSQSWSVSPSVSKPYQDAIKAMLGDSWGKAYSNEAFTVNVVPHKTVWVTFIPVMDKSEGQVQKYFIPRGSSNRAPIIERSYSVVTYNPKHLTEKMESLTVNSLYGAYVWHEN